MAEDISIVLTKDRPALPTPAIDTIAVVADADGKIYTATFSQMQQVLPIIKNSDFAILLKATQCLEYIILDNDAPMEIIISTTQDGAEIRSFTGEQSIRDGQPIELNRYTKNDEVIFIKGVLENTITKIKIS